ncbi:MAG: metallopeptidase family protein, partial [Acidimicrobiia bacterium]
NVLPDRIAIFQKPIERECQEIEDMRDMVAQTIIHEIGHYFGLSEDEIEAIERDYWSHRTGS